VIYAATGNMGEQYFKGVLVGYLGANFIIGPISELQILEIPSGTIDQSRADIIKENCSHYCEATVDHFRLSYQEKEEWKRGRKSSKYL